jgi:hypothetical protein
MRKIEINEKLIPIVPKKYQFEKGFICCEDILCEGFCIDCEDCPMAFGKIHDNDMCIINTNEKLVEIRLCEGFWSITNKTLKDIVENGIDCCDIQCFCMKEEIDCECCKFNDDKTYSLEKIIWREID